jgi:hypothetical protein
MNFRCIAGGFNVRGPRVFVSAASPVFVMAFLAGWLQSAAAQSEDKIPASSLRRAFASIRMPSGPFFRSRGGVRTFGYPVSRTFTLDGFPVQIFHGLSCNSSVHGLAQDATVPLPGGWLVGLSPSTWCSWSAQRPHSTNRGGMPQYSPVDPQFPGIPRAGELDNSESQRRSAVRRRVYPALRDFRTRVTLMPSRVPATGTMMSANSLSLDSVLSVKAVCTLTIATDRQPQSTSTATCHFG